MILASVVNLKKIKNDGQHYSNFQNSHLQKIMVFQLSEEINPNITSFVHLSPLNDLDVMELRYDEFEVQI